MNFIQVNESTLINLDAISTIEKDERSSDFTEPFLIRFYYTNDRDDSYTFSYEHEKERDDSFSRIMKNILYGEK